VTANAEPAAPTVQGFEELPAKAASVATSLASSPTALPPIAAAPAQIVPASAPVQRLEILPSFLMTMRDNPALAAPTALELVRMTGPAEVVLNPIETTLTPLALAQEAAPALASQAPLPAVAAAAPDAELILVSAAEPSPAPVAEPVPPQLMLHTILEVQAPSHIAATRRPRLARIRHAAAPSVQLVAEPATEHALAPLLVAFSEPAKASVRADRVVLARKAMRRRRLRDETPDAVLTEAPPASGPQLTLIGATPMFLESFERPTLAGLSFVSLESVAPDAVLTVAVAPAPQAAPAKTSADVVPAAKLALASYDAPVATVPELQQLDSAEPDLVLTSPSPGVAVSAQTVAEPASASIAAPAPPANVRPAEVIELAQAAPAPAPTPPAAPAPPPAVAPAGPAPAAAPAPVVPAANQQVVVQRIIVQGNERIEASTILSYLPIQVGDTVDAAKLDLAVKTLHRTDLFADESMEMQGNDLIVRVSENPIINQVVFEGNHAMKEDKLRDEVTVRPRGIFTRSKVEEDAQKIIELYRRSGRISATVTPKIVQLPQKRVDLIFEINEGPKSGIVRINFVGNKSFGDDALRDVIVTRESHWYKFFQSQDNYDPDRIEYDREQLRKFYRNHGFYDFRIVSAVAELAPERNGFVVTFTVDEGPKYHFGALKVTTELKRLNGELLQALLPIRSGAMYEDDRIEKATDALTYAAGANGFAFVDVRPRYVAHPETRTVDVDFDIKEGPRVYIERIDIVGNTRTLDYVIRRQMRVAEGDAYNRVLVDRSKQQIKSLGFFKDVDIEQLPGSSPDKTVLRVKVTEQPTGQLSFSVGYSSLEKLVGDVGISESNFRGRGQLVDFEVSMGYLQKRVSLSFTEPRFLGRNMAAGFDIYNYDYNYQTTAAFSSSSTGIQLRTQFPINTYTAVTFRYSIHTDNVTLPTYVLDPTNGICADGYSQTLCDEVGRTFTSAVGFTVRIDRRNDVLIPTRGFYVDFSQDFAGLGGVKYIKTIADAAWFYGFSPKWILSVKGVAGYITGWGGDSVRINDRFFEGGDSFRGFQIAGIGPRDTTLQAQGCVSGSGTDSSGTNNNGTCYGDALGAKAYAIGTIELQFPNLIPEQYGIKTALFTDFGTAGILDGSAKRNPDGTLNPYVRDNLAFRASTGISVFWKSPMGPLRFDFSKVLKKTPYDVPETFYFSTATSFQ
jgi:outer membrane protein insertion porin family